MRLCSLVVGAALLAPLAAVAQDTGSLVAIQQRKYRLGHELEVSGMFEPLDAFTKGVAVEGSYTIHFDDAWSWEVLRGGYVGRIDTGLHQQLLNEFGVEPTLFESLQWYASSNFLYSPLYGKFALRNASVVHVEAFISIGGALGHFSTLYSGAPELGVGFRIFLSQAFSLRFDARDAYFIGKRIDQNNKLFLSLGLSINLGGSD
jgi:outer membrane beta-barrel protein